MIETVDFSGRSVGKGEPPFFIAEIGANHNGDMELCRQLIDAAAECGADAVKFQSWTSRSLISRGEYERNTRYSDRKKHFGSLEEMVKQYELTPEMHVDIQSYCLLKGITFCSTPFSFEEADMLEELDVPFFKIASMDINYLTFLRHVARKMRPIVLSTGMADIDEIRRATDTIRNEGNDQLVLLHCVALYPPDKNAVHLRNIPMLSEEFNVPVGFSDHTLGISCSIAAITLGACLIEKHFTLDKDLEGWDHAISADPSEMKDIVDEGVYVWQSLGSYNRVVSEDEVEKAKAFRRSIVAKRPLKKGMVLFEDDLGFKRPGTGIKPDEVSDVIGKTLVRDVAEDEVLTWDLLE